MSSGLRPMHWKTRAGEVRDIATAYGLRFERVQTARDGDGWTFSGSEGPIFLAADLAQAETWLHGYGWGFRFEPVPVFERRTASA